MIAGREAEGGGERGGDAKSADWKRVLGVWREESQPSADGSNMFAGVWTKVVGVIVGGSVGDSMRRGRSRRN